MKPHKQEQIPQQDLFQLRLDQMLDQRHVLYKLVSQIEWHRAEGQFGSLYSDEVRPDDGRTALPDHAFDLSDEEVVTFWIENPYGQYFCGQTYFRHTLPIDPLQMTRCASAKLAGSPCWV